MFTGLIECLGSISHIAISSAGQTILTIVSQHEVVLQGCQLGDSIAVNGVCLTVTQFSLKTLEFTVGLSPETLKRTNLVDLSVGSLVNLEKSITATTKIGGHFVQGHVDGTGKIKTSEKNGDSLRIVVECSPELLKFIVEKGYIAIDGISLTVVSVNQETQSFEVMLIQYTQQKVALTKKHVGERVNLECDIMGKQIVAYLERYMKAGLIKAKL
jgi:riboflavin synthase